MKYITLRMLLAIAFVYLMYTNELDCERTFT